MKKQLILNGLVLIGIILYNVMFWQEKLGLNTLIFGLFIIGALMYLHPGCWLSPGARITIAGSLLSGMMVVWTNSDFSKTVHILSMMVMAGFVQQRELRFYGFGLMLYGANLIRVPGNVIVQIGGLFPGGGRKRVLVHWMRLSLLPGLILPVFFFIYYLANPVFAALSDRFLDNLIQWLSIDISFERLMFIFASLFVSGAFFWPYASDYFQNNQEKWIDTLHRSKTERQKGNIIMGMLALKNEFRMGLILLGALNLLLFIVNCVDIPYVWFGTGGDTPQDLKSYVHEGTSLLILGIILAILVILWIFRKNLNFYPGNRVLRIAAICWLAQNAILAISVGMRNVRYVENYGLAYKRIGVFIFLLLVLYGLWTMYVKVSKHRSGYYLWQRNATALYFVLILSSCLNWDVLITLYNLKADTKDHFLDTRFLINEVSDKNIYLLMAYEQELIDRSEAPLKSDISKWIESKRDRFIENQKHYSWLSWNYPDYRNKKYLGAQ